MAENFARRLEASSRRTPGKPALVWDGGALTFGELDQRVSALAETLAARGVKAGDRIALSIGNHWAFPIALIAGWKLGAAVAPLDTLLKDEERAAILADLEAALVISETDVEAVGRGLGAPGTLGRLRHPRARTQPSGCGRDPRVPGAPAPSPTPRR